jgi:hypothetical protein
VYVNCYWFELDFQFCLFIPCWLDILQLLIRGSLVCKNKSAITWTVPGVGCQRFYRHAIFLNGFSDWSYWGVIHEYPMFPVLCITVFTIWNHNLVSLCVFSINESNEILQQWNI